MEIEEKFLPIGTVVLLKEGTKEVTFEPNSSTGQGSDTITLTNADF